MINETTKAAVLSLIENFQIEQLCDHYFDAHFLWEVKGTGLLSKTYTDKALYLKEVLGRLKACLLPGGKLHIWGTYTDKNVMIVELQGCMKAKNHKDYHNEYCWISPSFVINYLFKTIRF